MPRRPSDSELLERLRTALSLGLWRQAAMIAAAIRDPERRRPKMAAAEANDPVTVGGRLAAILGGEE